MDIKFYFGIIFFIMLLMLIVIFVLVDVCYELKDEMVKMSSAKKPECNKKKEKFKPAYYIPKADEIKEHRTSIDIPFDFDGLVSDMEIKEALGKQLIDEILPYVDIYAENDFATRNVKYIGRIRVIDTKEDKDEVRK